MIIVTGATGQLGSQVVEALLERLPAEAVGVSVRDVGKAGGLAARGVRVRRGDYRDPASLAAAFEGATQVLLVSSNDSGAAGQAQHRDAVDAARAAGARRVLYTSHQASSPASLFVPLHDHARTEEYLRSSGGAFTSLRNGFYANTVPAMMLGDAARTGTIVAPADGPVSWTAHRDLAAATAAVLADEGRLDGIGPPLTAPEALDLADVARLLSEITGRTVERVVVDDEDFRASMLERGAPAAAAAMALGVFQASRRGEFAVTDPTLEELLGRPATPLRAVLDDALARV